MIASDRAGASEKVTNGETGFVCPPTVEAMAVAMRELAHLDTARHMGRAGYERFWTKPLTAAAHAEALTRAYGRMLAERPAAAGETPTVAVAQPA